MAPPESITNTFLEAVVTDRMSRVNSTLREVLAEEIERMSDSRLNMVSVTAVDTAPNLRHAVVYVDVESREPALAALRGAARRLQGVIGSQVRMKYTPTLEFAIDPGITGGERIDEILRELHSEEEE
jgi:ribosome-binding factor A